MTRQPSMERIMSNTEETQKTEEQKISDTQTLESDDSNHDNDSNNEVEKESGFDVVLGDGETEKKQDSATNAKFAKARIERKRQRELEQQLEAVRVGNIPETLRVNPDLPAQPDINQYLSDEGLEKYGYDQSRALAAFSQANNEWLIKAQDARSNAMAEQSRKTQEYTQHSTKAVESVRKHYDLAEKLNIPDYQEKEDAFRQAIPEGVDTAIMDLFPEKSAAIMYHLGANPEKLRRIISLDGQRALIELTKLSEQLTIKPRSKAVSSAPAVDEPVSGQLTASNVSALQKQMEDAASKGDTAAYRKLKEQLRRVK